MPRSWLAKESVPIKQIVRRTGYSRGMVRHVIRGERTDVFRGRQSTIDSYLPFLDAQWSHGCRNGVALWRRLRMQGFARFIARGQRVGNAAADGQKKRLISNFRKYLLPEQLRD